MKAPIVVIVTPLLPSRAVEYPLPFAPYLAPPAGLLFLELSYLKALEHIRNVSDGDP